jgi:hypothetical protein
MLQLTNQRLVHPRDNSYISHLGTGGSDVYVDGSTIEMLSWNFVQPDDEIYRGTMREYARISTPFGGYRRLEPQLSLVGESVATEYDLSEWVLLDLRIGEAWRKMGNAGRADQLLDTITELARVNDDLIPELLDPSQGAYAGVVPMVGYGAGAWQVAQLEKHGRPFPNVDVGFAHCEGVEPPPDPGDPPGDPGDPPDDPDDPPDDPDDPGDPQDPGPRDPVDGDDQPAANPWDDGAASLCSSGSSGADWAFALLPLVVLRRRRGA